MLSLPEGDGAYTKELRSKSKVTKFLSLLTGKI